MSRIITELRVRRAMLISWLVGQFGFKRIIPLIRLLSAGRLYDYPLMNIRCMDDTTPRFALNHGLFCDRLISDMGCDWISQMPLSTNAQLFVARTVGVIEAKREMRDVDLWVKYAVNRDPVAEHMHLLHFLGVIDGPLYRALLLHEEEVFDRAIRAYRDLMEKSEAFTEDVTSDIATIEEYYHYSPQRMLRHSRQMEKKHV